MRRMATSHLSRSRCMAAGTRSGVSQPFDRPKTGRIAVKVINHLGDEVMKVFGVA